MRDTIGIGVDHGEVKCAHKVRQLVKVMNDPHVKALHYWVNHDDSVDYEDAKPLEFENDLFSVCVDKEKVAICPKNHYATEEEAKEAVERFVRNWEFEAALVSASGRFSLIYAWAEIYDCNPSPTTVPSGTIQLSAIGHAGHVTGSLVLRVGTVAYPKPPSGPLLNVDTQLVQAMLSRLDNYHKRREPLASMAYFCLTMLEDNAAKPGLKTTKEKQTRDYYGISRRVLNQVSRLSSEKGGSEARKVKGFGQNYTQEEKRFLIAAVQVFIRRVAERETNPNVCLPEITLADLPSVAGS